MPWSIQIRTASNTLTDDDVAQARTAIGRALLVDWAERELFDTIVENAKTQLAARAPGAYVVELCNDGPTIWSPTELEQTAAGWAVEAANAKKAADDAVEEQKAALEAQAAADAAPDS
jgi:hypothetical protein